MSKRTERQAAATRLNEGAGGTRQGGLLRVLRATYGRLRPLQPIGAHGSQTLIWTHG